MLESANALGAFFFSLQVAQKVRVVIGCDHSLLHAAIASWAAEQKPQERASQRNEYNKKPERLGKRTHTPLISQGDVYERKDHDRESCEPEGDEYKAGHAVNSKPIAPYTGRVKPWLFYSIVRLALFGAVLALLMFLSVEGWLAAILAAIIALCISYIFFAGERDKVATSIHEWRERAATDKGRDEEDEDSEIANRP